MSDTPRGAFATVVPRVDRFPLPIRLLGYALLLVNLYFFVTFLVDVRSFAPDLPETGSARQIVLMLAGRQLAVAIVFAIALFGKSVRFMQLAWGLAFLRELADLAGAFARGEASSAISFAVLLLAELAIFVYMGAIASGRVAKYRQA